MNMNSSYITINEAAKFLGVSIDTLRRWDKNGKLKAIRQQKWLSLLSSRNNRIISSRYFCYCKNWVTSFTLPPTEHYCPDSLVFKARLADWRRFVKIDEVKNIFPLITAIVGEVGNNFMTTI